MLAFWKNNESVSIPLDELKHEDFSEVIWVEIDNEEDYKLCNEIGDKVDFDMPIDDYTLEEILKIKVFVLIADSWVDASDYQQKLDEANMNIWDTDC